MSPAGLRILIGLAAALAIASIWNWISGWGLVTVHESGQPVGKIIRSIEKQGGIKIVTTVPPETTISMDVDRVPPVEAVDMLAARLDANWSVGYVAGPTRAEVAAGIAGIAAGEASDDFRSFGVGGGGGGFGGEMEVVATPVDARIVEWKVSASDSPQLHSYLDQLSQKTGLMAMLPESWNPNVSSQPKGGKAGDALRDLVKSVNGAYEEIFVLRVWNRDRMADAGRDPSATRSPGTDGGIAPAARPEGGGGRDFARREPNPEWMRERAMASIEQLPADEREQAKKDFDGMREVMDRIRALPEQERRAAMEEVMNSPAVQQRMSDRMAERDEKRGPERRAARSREYIQRKREMKQMSQ